MNTSWRTSQLNATLGVDNTNPIFELYRIRLRLDDISTNAVVLRCAKEDEVQVENQLLNLQPGVIGKNVEFIPYRMLHQMNHKDQKHVYYLQNQHIAEHGAIAIQGIPEEIMLEKV